MRSIDIFPIKQFYVIIKRLVKTLGIIRHYTFKIICLILYYIYCTIIPTVNIVIITIIHIFFLILIIIVFKTDYYKLLYIHHCVLRIKLCPLAT